MVQHRHDADVLGRHHLILTNAARPGIEPGTFWVRTKRNYLIVLAGNEIHTTHGTRTRIDIPFSRIVV